MIVTGENHADVRLDNRRTTENLSSKPDISGEGYIA